MNDCIECVTVG